MHSVPIGLVPEPTSPSSSTSKPPAMPMHIPSSIDTDASSIRTSLSMMGPIMTPLSPATQNDLLGILQREQDHAMSLLSLSPLLSSLFISYSNRVAALESASATPSPESEEWKSLQTTIATLREENERLESEAREMAGKLEAAEASQEAFRSQTLSLKEANTVQRDDIASLLAELSEANDKYNQLMMGSNAEKSALQVQVMDLEAQRGELKETVVDQQIKISKLERQVAPPCRPPSPHSYLSTPSIPSSPTLYVPAPLPGQGEAVPSPSPAPGPSFSFHGENEPMDIPPSRDSRDWLNGPVPQRAPRGPGPQRLIPQGPPGPQFANDPMSNLITRF